MDQTDELTIHTQPLPRPIRLCPRWPTKLIFMQKRTVEQDIMPARFNVFHNRRYTNHHKSAQLLSPIFSHTLPRNLIHLKLNLPLNNSPSKPE